MVICIPNVKSFPTQKFAAYGNIVTTTKYIKYIESIHRTLYSFYHAVLVKFYCDVITRSRLQLINTSINTFFSKLCAFLVEQRRMKEGQWWLKDGAVDESSADQEICKSGATVHTWPMKNLEACT